MEPEDYDAIAADTKKYVGDILEGTSEKLEKSLASLFGQEDKTYIEELWKQVEEHDLGDPEPGRKTDIGKL